MTHHVHTPEKDFYQLVLTALSVSSIDFLVGGGYALECYTGIQRDTRDCDIFVRPGDCQKVLALFSGAGYNSTLVFPHWLGKVTHGECTVDETEQAKWTTSGSSTRSMQRCWERV
jgi:hypothetical protein